MSQDRYLHEPSYFMYQRLLDHWEIASCDVAGPSCVCICVQAYRSLHHEDNRNQSATDKAKIDAIKKLKPHHPMLGICFLAGSFDTYILKPQPIHWLYSSHSIRDEHPALHFRLPQKKWSKLICLFCFNLLERRPDKVARLVHCEWYYTTGGSRFDEGRCA